jgi:hypothetical protein
MKNAILSFILLVLAGLSAGYAGLAGCLPLETVGPVSVDHFREIKRTSLVVKVEAR